MDQKEAVAVAEKIFHPSELQSTVKELDPECLDLFIFILHGFGWFTQQGGIEKGLEFLRWAYDIVPEGVLKACANGLTVILDAAK